MSINSNTKDMIVKHLDLGNKLVIITSLEDIFELWSKVFVKKPAKNYFQCMSAKLWVKSHKKKRTVAKKIHNLKPSLRLFDFKRNFNVKSWKKFKKDYSLTRHTMSMFLSLPGDSFFTAYRQKKSKNKSVEEI